jgi:polysaccharide export outer membrane protein
MNRFYSLLLLVMLSATTAFAQNQNNPTTTPKPSPTPKAPLTKDSGLPTAKAITDNERTKLRREDLTEEDSGIVPYINNFFSTTRLGPEDVIAVDVFDKPNYSKANMIIPPDGIISYPQIGRVLVAGRTVPEIEKEVTERLREYIIDPQVTVQLQQSHSQKVFIVGDVGSPGIYEMGRRLTVTEALARAGYITKYGDREKVAVLRAQPNGQVANMPINMKDVEKGKIRDFYLVPGDTIVVPGNRYKTAEKVLNLSMMAVWFRVFLP